MHIAVEEGTDFDSLVWQVMEQGKYNFQPNKVPKQIPNNRKGNPQMDPKLKTNTNWIKAVVACQRAIVQYAELILKLMAKKTTMP